MFIATGSVQVVVRNCLIAGNKLTGIWTYWGAGLYLAGDGGATPGPSPLDVRVESCTIVDNDSEDYFGGMNMRPSGVQVWNTIVASNRAVTYPDLSDVAANIAPFHYSCSPALSNVGNRNITDSPSFADGAGNWRLSRNSPCITAGTNRNDGMVGAVDLDGRERIDRFSGRVDMGAYEYVPVGTLICLH